MKAFHTTTIALIVGLAATGITASLFADSVQVNITASTQITNVPSDFNVVQFALLEPWYFGPAPGFAISSTPNEQTLSVDSGFNVPTLELTDNTPTSPNHGLTWFYACNGLTLNYGSGANTATIAFTGQIYIGNPSYGVTCTCSGSTCSTTATLPAKLVMR